MQVLRYYFLFLPTTLIALASHSYKLSSKPVAKALHRPGKLEALPLEPKLPLPISFINTTNTYHSYTCYRSQVSFSTRTVITQHLSCRFNMQSSALRPP